MKTYAKIRGTNFALELWKRGKYKLFEENPHHPTYFQVIQPDRLDANIFNIIIVAPFTLKNWRVRSIDLEFLTEDELKKELMV